MSVISLRTSQSVAQASNRCPDFASGTSMANLKARTIVSCLGATERFFLGLDGGADVVIEG
jgi:hypothetical protein